MGSERPSRAPRYGGGLSGEMQNFDEFRWHSSGGAAGQVIVGWAKPPAAPVLKELPAGVEDQPRYAFVGLRQGLDRDD